MRTLLLALLLTSLPLAACGDGGGSSKEAFCDLARKYEEDFDDTGEAEDPADVEREYRELAAAVDDLVDVAPPEIEEDADKVNEAFKELNEILEKYDYDFAKVPPAEAEAAGLDDPEVQEAGNRVEAYFETECGIDSDDDGDTDGVVEEDPAPTTSETDSGPPSDDEQAPDETPADTADDRTATTGG